MLNIVMDPREYFRNEVALASERLQLYLGEDLEFYLVNLLCEFVSLESFNHVFDDGEGVFDKPLAFILAEAEQQTEVARKVEIFRRLGDTSLYVSGCFQEYFNRKIFDINYYIEMGSLAYSRAAAYQKSSQVVGAVYSDLAAHFSQLVDVLAEMSESPQSPKNLLAIYDRWTRSQSERLRKILQEEGIDPIPVSLKMAQ